MIDQEDYVDELESYLKCLNLTEPYFDCKVKKEILGNALRVTHICYVKVCVKFILPVLCLQLCSFCGMKYKLSNIC